MKNLKKITAVFIAAAVLITVGTAFAAEFKTPAEIVSALTGKSVDDLAAARAAGQTYGTIANENGQLEEFQAQMFEQKKAILDQRVEDGVLTQERADEIYEALEERIATCDGTGAGGLGRQYGAGFGGGYGMGQGSCGGGFAGTGRGSVRGGGMGFGRGLNR